MSELNWGNIRSGATFESLVHSLVLFEDPKAFLFSRPGKDRGQDARSGDGRIVYQAKFRQSGSAADVRKAVKKEAETIEKHRSESIWKDVTQWILVTNVGFNPNDDRVWNEEIAPRFEKLGIIASYWERAELETRLHQYPDLKHAYFGGENRIFLSLPEAREILKKQDIHPVTLDADYQGRAEEIKQFENFFDEENRSIAIVHGARGVGKTRFLIESAEYYLQKEKPDNPLNQKWQIFWANITTMESSNLWFQGIIPERPTLLLIDEPEDRKLFDRLLEQLNIRGNQWKVLIAIRSPKDIVLGYLQKSLQRKQIEEIKLEPLTEDAAKAFCLNLFELGNLRSQDQNWKEDTANWIVKHYNCYPVFIVLAVNRLEETGELKDFPQKSEHLLARYFQEIIFTKSLDYSDNQVRNMLRWIALFRKINTENKEIINFIQSKVEYKNGSTVLRCFQDLVKRNVLFKSGSYARFLEIKPDIFRDYLLKEWFIISKNFGRDRLQLSDGARELCEYLAREPLESKEIKKAILHEIARFEFMQRQYGDNIDILSQFVTAICTNLQDWSVREKLAAIDLLHEIAFNRVGDILNICDRLLESSSQRENVETIFGERTLTHDRVILALSWLIYQAVPCAEQKTDQDRIVDILCKLAIREDEIAIHLNKDLSVSDRHAKDILSKIIKEEESFLGSFSRSAFKKAQQILGEIRKNQNIQEQKIFFDTLFKPLLSIEREYTSFDGRTVTFIRSTIVPNSDRWNKRTQLQKTIRIILEERSLNSSQSVHFWNLLNEAHESVSNALGEADKHQNLKNYSQDFHKEVKQDLIWVLQFFKSNQVDISELQAARQIWDWHYRWDEDSELKQLATRCEEILEKHEMYLEYEPLIRIGRDPYQERQKQIKAKAKELARSQTSEEISDFFRNGVKYINSLPRSLPRENLLPVAGWLGIELPQSQVVYDFVRTALKNKIGDPEFRFGISVCSQWITNTRKHEPQKAADVFKDVLQNVTTSEKIVELTNATYYTWGKSVTAAELDIILTQYEHFVKCDRKSEFIIILSGMLFTNMEHILEVLKKILDTLDKNKLGEETRNILDKFYQAILANPEFSEDYSKKYILGSWILEQFIKIPHLNSLSYSSGIFRLILEKTQKPDLKWLINAIEQRIQMIDNVHYFPHFLPEHDHLSSLIIFPSAEELMSEKTQALIAKLIRFGEQFDWIAYALPVYLQAIDPEGKIVPDLIVKKLSDYQIKDNPKQVDLWSNIASAYPDDSIAWRKIARKSCILAKDFDESDRNRIFYTLIPKDFSLGHYSRPLGEIHPSVRTALEYANQCLKNETDPILIPFRKQVLEMAEKDLENAREKVKEELLE